MRTIDSDLARCREYLLKIEIILVVAGASKLWEFLFRPVQRDTVVSSNLEQPVGKLAGVLELADRLISVDKGILADIKRIIPISCEPVSEVKQLLLPTSHQHIKSCSITSNYPLDQISISQPD